MADSADASPPCPPRWWMHRIWPQLKCEMVRRQQRTLVIAAHVEIKPNILQGDVHWKQQRAWRSSHRTTIAT
eukprot:239503-Pyramimonas_sp.AAC.1